MKYAVYILFMVLSQNVQSQTPNTEVIFFDIVDLASCNKNSEIGYLKKVHLGMFSYDLKNFESHKSLTYRMFQRSTRFIDSIALTPKEKKYLLTELKASKDFEWNLTKKTTLKIADNSRWLTNRDSSKKHRNRRLKIVSKPIFIRNNTIACVYSTDLCCGKINGHTSLSLYKRINNKWTEWIAICQGDF
ncbi:MAG: hypothetical protein AB8B65_17970 [Kordia sp.]|uniref:hypothetical protein n=1 Tax=Kordia sp. TaxID=1965332 RepID=UPI00385F3C79